MGYENFRILVDLPATRPALGFDQTAKGLAGLIRKSEPQFAIAIFGPWGSGKTTLMQAIQRDLKSERIIKVEFSAWRYEKEEHLILPLLDTLREALVAWSDTMAGKAETPTGAARDAPRKKAFAEAARNTARTVGNVMASLLAGLSFKVGIPGALDLSYDANKALTRARASTPTQAPSPAVPGDADNRTFSQRLDNADLPQSIYHACFTALAAAFDAFAKSTAGARIVVFVDDLDRCLPEGTLQVLESMKLFFDLRGFVFVVGLDRDIVERSIDTCYQLPQQRQDAGAHSPTKPLVRGADYIKKIFQVPYSLAPVSLNLLDDLFDSLKRDSRLPPAQMDDLELEVKPHLAYLFSGSRVNPREVKRYINAYVIQMQVKPGLLANVVLALNTIDFRPDCLNLSDALATYREETTDALSALLEGGDRHALEDVGLTSADLPNDIRTYLGPGGIGQPLLKVAELGIYLDAGAATRSTSGGYFLDLLTDFRGLRREVMQAFDASHPQELDGHWSAANSHYQGLLGGMSKSSSAPAAPFQAQQQIDRWLDPTTPSAWVTLLEALNGNEQGNLEQLRENAREEARGHLNSMRLDLRELRRRASLET